MTTSVIGSLPTHILSAVAERKKDGKNKSALVVSSTHAEAAQVTTRFVQRLQALGKLGEEQVIDPWIPAHLTEAQKTDATEYNPGDLLMFHQNAKGYTKGTRLVLTEGMRPPIELANRFEVYRPVPSGDCRRRPGADHGVGERPRTASTPATGRS